MTGMAKPVMAFAVSRDDRKFRVHTLLDAAFEHTFTTTAESKPRDEATAAEQEITTGKFAAAAQEEIRRMEAKKEKVSQVGCSSWWTRRIGEKRSDEFKTANRTESQAFERL
jgi:hypothetical protein